MDKDRKQRIIQSLKWGRLIIGLVGLGLLGITSYQAYRGIWVILPYYKIGTLVIGSFSILLGAENYISSSESFVNKFLILYGAIMLFMTIFM